MTEIDTEAAAAAISVVAGVGAVRVDSRNGGHVLRIETPQARALVALQGAQVIAWQPAHAAEDVLWWPPAAPLGNGQAIRGGVPVCWPWFGRRREGEAQHGYARNRAWRLTSAAAKSDQVRLDFVLPGGEPLSATLSIEIGAELALTLETRNAGAGTAALSTAFHPYFRIGDVARATVDGFDGATALDLNAKAAERHQSGPIAFDTARETTLRFDRAPAHAHVLDPILGRRITVTRTAGRSAVVWHPGPVAAGMADIPSEMAHTFVCVETGDVGASEVQLAPGAVHRSAVRYAVARL